MYCTKCGSKIENNELYCPECGNNVNNLSETKPKKESGSSFGWGILGFFFPLVGLILFLVWKNDRSSDSKAAGIGALIGTIALILLYIIIFVVLFSIGFNSGYNSIYY